MAAAETPVPFALNVERVVVSCEFSGDIQPADHPSLCGQLVLKAQQITDLPVVSGSTSTSSPRDLHIHLKGIAREAEGRRKSLALYAVPKRSSPQVKSSASTISTVTLQQIRDDWVVLGPVDIFVKLLGSAPRSLHTPFAE